MKKSLLILPFISLLSIPIASCSTINYKYKASHILCWGFNQVDEFLKPMIQGVVNTLDWSDIATTIQTQLNTSFASYGISSVTINSTNLSSYFNGDALSSFCSDIKNYADFISNLDSKLGTDSLSDMNNTELYYKLINDKKKDFKNYINNSGSVAKEMISDFCGYDNNNFCDSWQELYKDLKSTFSISRIGELFFVYGFNYIHASTDRMISVGFVWPMQYDSIIWSSFINAIKSQIYTIMNDAISSTTFNSPYYDVLGKTTNFGKNFQYSENFYNYSNYSYSSVFNQLRPGDIICWNLKDKTNIGHVAIFTGWLEYDSNTHATSWYLPGISPSSSTYEGQTPWGDCDFDIANGSDSGKGILTFLEASWAGTQYGALNGSDFSDKEIFRINEISNYSNGEYEKILDWAKTKIGCKYTLGAILTKGEYDSLDNDDNGYYCSEFLWKAFNQANYDICNYDWNEDNEFHSDPGCTPQNIYHYLLKMSEESPNEVTCLLNN